MLPTGHMTDQLDCTFGEVEATYCEVGNAVVFVEAEKLSLLGNEAVGAIDANKDLIARVKEVRGRMAQQLGKCADWRKVDEQSPMLPMVALVSKATSHQGNIQSRLFLDNRCHPSMAGTGGICTTAVSRIKGSVVNRLLSPGSLESDTLSIQHPVGYLPLKVHSTIDGQNGEFPSLHSSRVHTNCTVYHAGSTLHSGRYPGKYRHIEIGNLKKRRNSLICKSIEFDQLPG